MNPNETNAGNPMTSSNMGGGTGSMTPPATGGEKSGRVGAIVGILVIVIILIIGALYLWGGKLVNVPGPTGTETPSTETPSFQPSESTSSEIADIETDLSATALEGLDAELNSINAELGI